MKYTIEGYSQQRLVDLGLDATDAVLLRWFADFYVGDMEKWHPAKNGPEYGWVSYSYVISELPCLGLNKPDSVGKRFKKLRNCGVLIGKLRKDETGTTMWYCFAPGVYDSLTQTKIRTPTGNQSGPLPDEKQDNSSITNPSITDPKNTAFGVLPSAAFPKTSPNDPVYQFVKTSFEEKNGPFTNYGKEGKNIHWLIEKARVHDRDHPEFVLAQAISAFWDLKSSAARFWREQPFTPSALNSLFDRVWEHVREMKPSEDMSWVESIPF